MKKADIAKVPEFETAGYKFFAAIGRFSVRYRWFVIIVWVVGAVLIMQNLPSLSSVTQSDNTNFLPASSPTEKALKLESAFQPSGTISVPVVVSSNQPLTVAEQNDITLMQAKLSKVEGVKKVVNRGRSADSEAEIIEVQTLANSANSNAPAFIGNLRSAIKSVALPANLQVHLTGNLATEVDNSNSSGKQNAQLQLGTIIFIVVLLLIIFRAPLAPIITLIPPVLVVSAAGPIIAEAAKHGLKVSSLAQLLLTVLILGAGTDYGLFLIFRVREENEVCHDPREAIVKALSRVGESISFSAATVIVALLSLVLATFQIYSTLGVPLAMGVALMLLAGLTLLPALLAIFGRAVFWPMKPHQHTSKRFGAWGKISARIVQRPVIVLVVGVIFFGALAFAVPGYKASGFGGGSAPPPGTDSAEGTAQLNKHFPSDNANPTYILFVISSSFWQNPAEISQLSTLVKDNKNFNHVSGPLNPNGFSLSPAQITGLYTKIGSPWKLPALQPSSLSKIPPLTYQLYRSTSAYVSPDGKTIQYSVGLAAGDPGSTNAMVATPTIRSAISNIASKGGAKDSGMYGQSSAFYDISSISNSDLIRVIPIAVIVIGILLGFLMRSVVAPIYLVISVVLSYLAAFGVSVIIFMHFQHNSGLVFILPFLMFIFLLALGEDYNILVMTRIREEAHGLPLKQAVTNALNTTGTTVTSAGLVLAGTFTVLGLVSTGSANLEVREIGYGLAIGILMDTFLVRTLIVPSIVAILGKWNWWPTKHGSWVEQED
ncbi:MAG TPA: MMPL family transporter [Candidatus Saccharimonadales bacterium]|nr:MMPL family transporter [Candidatus Saccharimonadales bacterium]